MKPGSIIGSVREFGVVGYLRGLTYRVAMRIAHRYHWHYTPPIPQIERGKIHLWCKWCGFRASVPDMNDPMNQKIFK